MAAMSLTVTCKTLEGRSALRNWKPISEGPELNRLRKSDYSIG